ncbi:PilZ domain-containing protein [Motiliproteus sp. MSK22-1]|uniref:PilZ domain-containing protein n=1 Tax=Motiliproteus sp. MSK22-1 TaxID=1897630 RepID=UPI000975A190|nr:PilZ domain-containing protein [Motiliproteus sp. MSK22-1]OMH33776.1 hypothetical protein BGP75_12345 [Motiliproteus sp. MSK22-1]
MSQTPEKRRYFRLNDSLKVSYRKLNKSSSDSNKGSSLDAVYGQGSDFDLRFQTLIKSCKEKSPEVAELVGMLNQKLAHVISRLDVDEDLTQRVAFKLRMVNLSACGMAFPIEEQLDEGDRVSIDLVLNSDKDSEEQLSTTATVVACDELQQMNQGNPFYVRLNFDRLNPQTQKNLIQYLLNRQVQLHRHQKGNMAASSR